MENSHQRNERKNDMAPTVATLNAQATISEVDVERPSPPDDRKRTTLLRVQHELDQARTFLLADMTAVEITALGKQLDAHKDLRRARFRLARVAKIRPHKMELVCGLVGPTVVLSLLAPDDKDPKVIVELLLPEARVIEDEWFARDERTGTKNVPEPAGPAGGIGDGEPSNPPQRYDMANDKVLEGPAGQQANPSQRDPGVPVSNLPVGHVKVTYSAGGEQPRHPPLTLPPPPPRPVANPTLGTERPISCSILRCTATDRCMIKEVEVTRMKEATFSTSGELPTLINMLAGFPPVVLNVREYQSDQNDVPPPFAFHIVGLAALSDDWDQEVSMVAHLQACLDKISQLLKRLQADRLKNQKRKGK